MQYVSVATTAYHGRFMKACSHGSTRHIVRPHVSRKSTVTRAMNLSSRTPFGNRAPSEVHKVLTESTIKDSTKDGRVIVIGDVHGCMHELEALLDKCEYKPNDTLIFAGDVVNKGPESLKVLEKVRSLEAYLIRGNHEDACIALWRRLGVVSSLLKSYKWITALTKAHITYLQQLPFSITLEPYHIIVVHAGFVPDDTPLEAQGFKTMLFLEDVEVEKVASTGVGNKYKCYYKSTKDKEQLSSWAKYWRGKQHVLFGHASERGLQKFDYATGLDTGCVGGQDLTACILPPLKDLANHKPFKQYKEQHAGKRAPTLSELNARLESVPNTTNTSETLVPGIDTPPPPESDLSRAASDNLQPDYNLVTDSEKTSLQQTQSAPDRLSGHKSVDVQHL